MGGVDSCAATAWSFYTDPVTLTIVEGAQYVSFHEVDYQSGQETNLGSTATMTGNNEYEFSLVADGQNTDAKGDSIVVHAKCGILTSEDTIFLEPGYLDHFSVDFDDLLYPDVQHMDVKWIGLQPKNIYDHDIIIPGSTGINIMLDSSGMRYGNLIIGSREGKALSGVEWDSLSAGNGYFEYIADGEDPAQPAHINITVTVPGQNVTPANITLQVLPQPVIVSFTPAVISPGDTANIIIKQRDTDGSLSDFSADQQFEVGISSGEDYGTILLSDGSDSGYFSYVTQPFKFIAADSIDGDSVVVLVRAGTQAPGPPTSIVPSGKAKGGKTGSEPQPSHPGFPTGKSAASVPPNERVKSTVPSPHAQVSVVKSPRKSEISSLGKNNAKLVSDANTFSWSNYGIGYVVIENRTILLGETKYYYAIDDPNNPNNLIIKETTTNPPVLGPGRPDVTFDDPAAAPGSEKNPVYWEKKFPQYSGNTFTGMSPLPAGMIRLVGRYWEDGKTFKTTLMAHAPDGRTGSINIGVKKPSALGSLYPKAKDVFDNEISIDDTCIAYAGLYGIPPQLIKGQMEEEAATYDFGGHIGIGFAPSYRYEPYTVQFWKGIRNRTSNPFYVTLNDVDNPPVPNHKYVQKIPYIYPNKYVWDVIFDHSQLVNDIADDSHRLYGIRTYADTMNFLPYTVIQNMYHEFLSRYQQLPISLNSAASLANNDMIEFLMNQWDGDVPNGTKGLKNILAQTRIASSYGLLQMLYTTALYRHYVEDISHLPENLNVTSTIMDLSIPYEKSLLVNNIGASVESGGDWPDGFEKNLYDFVYANWNTRGTYNDEVFKKSRNYLPQP